VIFSTYQSIDVVAQAQRDGVPEFDLVIADEAHRTTGVTLADTVESQFVRVHDNSYIKAAKRLYMTATPRLFDPKVKDKATASDAVLVSMDDESLYGPVLHRLGFGEAVEKDLLTDYKVLVLKVDEGFVAESFQSELAQSGEIKLEDAAKLIGCWNGLAKRFGDTLTTDDLDGDDLTPMKTGCRLRREHPREQGCARDVPEHRRPAHLDLRRRGGHRGRAHEEPDEGRHPPRRRHDERGRPRQ
jgi:predicted helicase